MPAGDALSRDVVYPTSEAVQSAALFVAIVRFAETAILEQ